MTPDRLTSDASTQPITEASADAVAEPTAVTSNAAPVASLPVFAAVPASATVAPVQGADPGYRAVEVALGARNYGVAEQNLYSLGINWADERPENLVGYEIGFSYSPEDSVFDVGGATDVEGTSWELAAGARRTFRRDSELMPYFAAGLNYIDFELSQGSSSMSDGAVGIYTHFGVMAKLGETLRLGVDYRVSQAWTTTDLGSDISINYDMLSVLLTFAL